MATALDLATGRDIQSDRPTARTLLINAQVAKRMLERNTRNRNVSATVVEKYRRDMAAGRWVYAADPIRFDINGKLLDGQHRLAALAQCEGLSLPFLVVSGLPPETQQVMDSGRARLAGQQLHMAGVKNANIMAAAIKTRIIIEDDLLFRDNKQAQLITSIHIQQWAATHHDMMEAVRPIVSTAKSLDASPSVAIAAAFEFLDVDEEDTYEFFQLLRDGAGTRGHPIVTLDKTLQRYRRQDRKLSRRDALAMFFTAWNAWRSDRELTKFQRPRGGKWTAKTFPWPS